MLMQFPTKTNKDNKNDPLQKAIDNDKPLALRVKVAKQGLFSSQAILKTGLAASSMADAVHYTAMDITDKVRSAKETFENLVYGEIQEKDQKQAIQYILSDFDSLLDLANVNDTASSYLRYCGHSSVDVGARGVRSNLSALRTCHLEALCGKAKIDLIDQYVAKEPFSPDSLFGGNLFSRLVDLHLKITQFQETTDTLSTTLGDSNKNLPMVSISALPKPKPAQGASESKQPFQSNPPPSRRGGRFRQRRGSQASRGKFRGAQRGNQKWSRLRLR